MYKKMRKHTILIGGISNLPGPLTTITNVILNSPLLQKHFFFVSHYTSREKGLGRRARLNLTNIAYFVRHYTSWAYLLFKHRPDAVHYPITSYWNFTKSMLFLTTGKAFGCKTIGHLHGGSFDNFWDKLPKLIQAIGMRSLSSLDCLIVLGQSWKEFMIKKGFTSKLFILPNPIDVDFSKQDYLSPFMGNKVTLLFIGSVGNRKGVPILLHSVSITIRNRNDVRLLLVGPEEYSGELYEMQQLASDLLPKSSYEFTGAIYGKQKIEKFSECDIFVFPSNNENFPLVVIEAMAAARPIICTSVGAVPEYLEHGKSCLFVRPGDPDDLAQKIEWMLANPCDAIEMGKRAKKIFQERLVQEKIMEKLRKIYFSVSEESS